MADRELEQRLQQLTLENAVLQQKLTDIGSTSESTPKYEEQAVCQVAVKLPPFWPDKPAVWFGQVEAQFDIAGIVGDNTKYNYVIGRLDQKLAGEIEDIITRPPPIGQRYKKVNDELVRRLSMSEEQRVRQLISVEELGDRRPSQFLRHLRSLAGNTLTDENILRQLWMRRLPQNIQAILASQSELSLDKIADLADKITEISGPSHQVYSCAMPAPAPSVLDSLVKTVEDLSKQVASLTNSHPRGRSRSKSISRQRSRGASPRN
ncbi:unnamed protein product [Pieris macdunnoughi]|uniref:DUF7041 domain-containing protein n=1 Tax=Pieris macdunnoughi TaxID=345717 RepID=A0A821LTV8_9NEOP|nr:unnamed protein product [Pieris macdunnoughi]